MPFNIFKKKTGEPKEHEKTGGQEVQAEAPKAPKKKKAVKKLSSFGVITQPHITEKAALLNEKGKYVFRVRGNATKSSVKEAVEDVYGVEVKHVRMNKKPAKKIRLGRKQGTQPGYKKAVVTLKPGQSIEIISR